MACTDLRRILPSPPAGRATVTSMIMDGFPTVIDTDLPLFFSERIGPPIASKPTLPSHEIGHSLGLVHINAPKKETFLMHPVIQLNNTVIPSDTLEDLIG
jgi:hypothetical protein